jgi:SRSO17 transposase
VDHQGLQQFVSSSTWAVEPVRQRLARRAVRVIDPDAWVIDDIGFVKDGTASPGWPGSTPARWARSVTARSGSASAR